MKKYAFSSANANFITGLVYLISAFASPVLGFAIDKIGRNVAFVLTAVLMTLLSHILLAVTQINPYVSITMMGFGYSLLASALWPMVALIVPLHRQGTAFGKLLLISVNLIRFLERKIFFRNDASRAKSGFSHNFPLSWIDC